MTEISLLAKDISYIQRDISDIRVALKEGFATKDALIDVAKNTEERLRRLERQSNIWRFLSPTLSAAFSSVFTFLAVQYFSQAHR